MSSSIAFLAYVFNSRDQLGASDIRLQSSEEHLKPLYKSPLERMHVGDGRTGFVAWQPTDSGTSWQHISVTKSAAVAWLHIPSFAGATGSAVDERTLAESVIEGDVSAGDMGAPFAVIKWKPDSVQIVNDVLGLVRLFHFRFEGGDVWATRMGLAHIFMGVPPDRNVEAWHGMASLGWAPAGRTQLGDGRQLAGASRVSAGFHNDVRYVRTIDNFPNWFEEARTAAEPTATQNLRDMQQLMSTADRWPEKAVADLTGGKDSRVVSAVGIRSGSISTVRTVASDIGEVETASQLVRLVNGAVEHQIIEMAKPSIQRHDLLDGLSSQHKAWEGRFLATSGFNSAPFSAFRTARRAKFNGLGGEVLAAGSFYPGPWHEKMVTSPPQAAQDRLIRLIASMGHGASKGAKELAGTLTREFVEGARESGASTAAEVLDIFYSRDRMPNWSNTFTDSRTICPLFAASLLTWGARNIGAPVPDGMFHRKLLKEAIPQWSEVPFYKPTSKSRTKPYVWQTQEWGAIAAFIEERADTADSFDKASTLEILNRVDTDDGNKRDEVFIHRFLWDVTFAGYVQEVRERARDVARSLDQIRSS